MNFVVNEWLPEYFKPNSLSHEKEKLEKFLNLFMNRNDVIYVRRPSAFNRKIHRYKKDFQNNLKVNGELGKFINLILLNSDKCVFVDDNDFVLNEEIPNKLRNAGNTISDLYLFEAASITESKLIITTDGKLKKLFENDRVFKVELLDDFLKRY